jgi:hypothetical protein
MAIAHSKAMLFFCVGFLTILVAARHARIFAYPTAHCDAVEHGASRLNAI